MSKPMLFALALSGSTLLAMPSTTLAMGSLCDIQDRSLHAVANGEVGRGTQAGTAQPGWVRAQMAKAQRQIERGTPERALAVLDRLDDRQLGLQDQYFVAMLGAAAHRARADAPATALAYTRAIETGRVPTELRTTLLEALASHYYKHNDHQRAAVWVAAYREAGGDDAIVLELEPKALFLLARHADAETASRRLIREVVERGETPGKSLLQVWSYSLAKLEHRQGYAVAQKALTHYYPDTMVAQATP